MTTTSTPPRSTPTGEEPLRAATSPVLFCALACLLSSCATPPATLTVTAVPPPTSTAAVSTLAELVRAHASGGAPEVRRVLGERWRDRGAVEHGGAVVVGPGRAGSVVPLLLVMRLNDLAPCTTTQAGFVVEDPPRLVGCGAQDLAALAAFVLAAERLPRVTIVVGDTDDDIAAVSPLAARVWTGGGLMLQGQDADVFDLEAVDLGGFVIELRRADADATGLAVAVGRAAAWTSLPIMPSVVRDRFAVVPTAPWQDALTALASSPSTSRQVREQCAVLEQSTTQARLWCSVLPGHVVDDVRDAVVGAVDDAGTSLRIAERWTATATGFDDVVVRVLQTRLRQEQPRAVVAPALRTTMAPSACGAWRLRGVPCVGGVPLLVHPVERERAGDDDEAVAVDALTAMVSVVVDSVATIVGAP